MGVMTNTEFWDFVLLNQLWSQRVSFSTKRGSEHHHFILKKKTRTKYNERTWVGCLVTVFRLIIYVRTNLWNTCETDKLTQRTSRLANWFYLPILAVNEAALRVGRRGWLWRWYWIWQFFLGHEQRPPSMPTHFTLTQQSFSTGMSQWAPLEYQLPRALSVPYYTKTTSIMLQVVTTALGVSAKRDSIDNGGYPHWTFSFNALDSRGTSLLAASCLRNFADVSSSFKGQRIIGSSIPPFDSSISDTLTSYLSTNILSKKAKAKHLTHNPGWSPQSSGLMGFFDAPSSLLIHLPLPYAASSNNSHLSLFQSVSQRPVTDQSHFSQRT